VPDDDTWKDEVSRQRIINQTALKSIGEPDDIAKAVEFLIAAAPYVTARYRSRRRPQCEPLNFSHRDHGEHRGRQ